MNRNPLDSIETYEDAVAFAKSKLTLNTALTHFEAILHDVPNLETYYARALAMDNAQQIRSVGAALMDEVVKYAAPVSQQIWFCSEVVLKTMQRLFTMTTGTLKKQEGKITPEEERKLTEFTVQRDILIKSYDRFLPEECAEPTDTEIAAYEYCLKVFRKFQDICHDGMSVHEASVPQEVKVSGMNLGIMGLMVDDMINKRNKRIGAEPIKRKKSAGSHAMATYNTIITSEDDNPPLLEFPPNAKTAEGNFLLATAVARMVQKKMSDKQVLHPDNYFRKIEAHFPDIAEEIIDNAKNLIESTISPEKSKFNQQIMNIDSIFLTYFILFSIIRLPLTNFRKFQRIIYGCGRKTTGKAKVLSYLNSYKRVSGIKELIDKLSKSSDTYLPPWILNPGRVQELISVMGFLTH